MKNNLFIVIVGCGRLGSHLANQLSRVGHSQAFPPLATETGTLSGSLFWSF